MKPVAASTQNLVTSFEASLIEDRPTIQDLSKQESPSVSYDTWSSDDESSDIDFEDLLALSSSPLL
jgi:hypothetical protein